MRYSKGRFVLFRTAAYPDKKIAIDATKVSSIKQEGQYTVICAGGESCDVTDKFNIVVKKIKWALGIRPKLKPVQILGALEPPETKGGNE